MLPAAQGDAIWIEYGIDGSMKRLLVDGGPASAFPFIQSRIEQVPQNERSFELVVLTHVDADHIEGLIHLFAQSRINFTVDRIFFNGWRQMEPLHGLLGPLQGEFFSALLSRRFPGSAWDLDAQPWVVPDDGALPVFELEGGMKLTLLSPTPRKLDRMKRTWRKAIAKKMSPGDLEAAWTLLVKQRRLTSTRGLLGLEQSLDALLKAQFSPDDAAANGSSIAFLAEFEGVSALLLGDAHPDVVTASIRRLCAERSLLRLPVDAVKVSHHGSKKNTNKALLDVIDCPTFLISTNGDHHGHPDQECLARIIRVSKPKHIFFNYRSEFTEPWLTTKAQRTFGYRSHVRRTKELGIRVELPL